ncbi:hypothetical protein B0H10DRAFT_2083027 [Mycena sp. CBHHK59/15]|nr:hypothetical protein B0H10DRAFT_2083027 [Mycena sp. CBHHK59/15]
MRPLHRRAWRQAVTRDASAAQSARVGLAWSRRPDECLETRCAVGCTGRASIRRGRGTLYPETTALCAEPETTLLRTALYALLPQADDDPMRTRLETALGRSPGERTPDECAMAVRRLCSATSARRMWARSQGPAVSPARARTFGYSVTGTCRPRARLLRPGCFRGRLPPKRGVRERNPRASGDRGLGCGLDSGSETTQRDRRQLCGFGFAAENRRLGRTVHTRDDCCGTLPCGLEHVRVSSVEHAPLGRALGCEHGFGGVLLKLNGAPASPCLETRAEFDDGLIRMFGLLSQTGKLATWLQAGWFFAG